MTGTGRTANRIAGLCIAAALLSQLGRFWWFELGQPSAVSPGLYALDQVLSIVHSPLWYLGGSLHLATAAAIAVLAATPARPPADVALRAPLRASFATIGAGAFVLLGMMHLVGVPQIGLLSDDCPADGRTVLVAYDLLRTVLAGSGYFVLGSYLLVDAGPAGRTGAAPRLLRAIGLLAGVSCVSFPFLFTAAPRLTTTLTMLAVAAWGFGQAVPQPASAGRQPDGLD